MRRKKQQQPRKYRLTKMIV